MMTVRTFFTVLVLLLVGCVGIVGIYMVTHPARQPETITPQILSFADCALAGYPVEESMPRRCMMPDGRVYTEEPTETQTQAMVTYDNASVDMIVVTNPTPGSVTGKEFIVTGKARGNWYFEASFPIEVRNADGKVLATGIAQAQGDWMTSEFVPFTATMKIPDSYIGTATLVAKNDNPSGLPENERSVSIPFTIEY